MQSTKDSADDARWKRRSLSTSGGGMRPPMYEFTCELTKLEPPPLEMQRLFEALRDNPGETARFFGVLALTVPVAEFFAPENIRRIIGT